MINYLNLFLAQTKPVSTASERYLLVYMIMVLIIITSLVIVFFVVFQKRKNKLLLERILEQQDFEEEIKSIKPFIDNIKTYNDLGNEKLKAVLIHTVYYYLKENLEHELEMEILPINTFMRNVKYDDFGYPDANIRQAIKEGDSRYYFRVDIQLESLAKDKRDESPELFEDRDYPVTYPELSIEITVYNNEGIKSRVPRITGITDIPPPLQPLLLTRPGTMGRYYLVRGESDYIRLVKTVKAISRAIENEIFYPAPSQMSCGTCDFPGACGEHYARVSVQEYSFIRSLLVVSRNEDVKVTIGDKQSLIGLTRTKEH